MRLLQRFAFALLFLVFSSITFAKSDPLSKFTELATIQDRTEELGMPFSSIEISALTVQAGHVFHYSITPQHVFSCFGVGWETTEMAAQPEDFIIVYRTLSPEGTWTKWITIEGEVHPTETPTGLYWTDATFTDDASSHVRMEIEIHCPVAVNAIRIDLFDGNVQEASAKANETPQEEKASDEVLGARVNCPEFPAIITRAQWCGGSASCSQVNAWYNPTYISPTHVVVHHGASPNTYTDGQAVVRSYYNYHVNTLGWIDIGYNYLIDKDGNFFQGRHNPNLPTTDVRGAHAGAANSGSIGICYPGNADVTIATPIQMQRASEFLAWWFDHKAYDPLSSASMQTQAFGVQNQPRITGHRDIGQTFCPGNDLHSRLPNLRSAAKQIIDDCNNIVVDDVPPSTIVNSNYDWRGYDFWADFSDSDNPGGSGVDEQYYQVMDFDGSEWRANATNGFFNDNFDAAIHSDWTIHSGTWVIDNGALYQNDETDGNTNIYAALAQNNQSAYLYQWSANMQGSGGNRRSGLHFFVDNPTGPNRGNSYLAWFRADDNAYQLYKVNNDVLNMVVNLPLTVNANTWYDFKVTFNPSTGRIEAFMNDELVSSYVDPSPYTSGQYISLRNGDALVRFDNLKVRRSRGFTEKITVGPQPANDARYESPNPTQDACRINSLVKDAAGNWSTQNAKNIYVDWTPPTTSSTVANTWQTEDVQVEFTDEDNVDGSGITRRFYQVIDFDGQDWRANAERGFFSDNFDQATGIHPEWTVVNGSWNNTNGFLEQTDETQNNTNIYAYLKQDLSNRYLYHFQMKLDGAGNNKRGGVHYFADDPTATNRGNSYFVWFRQDLQTLEFYKVTNDTFTQEKVYPLEFLQNQWMDVKLVFDRITGETFVYKDDKLVGEWQDSNPISSGDYISFRSGNGNLAINNLKVYRTRFPNVTVTLGDPSADIRYQNPDPSTIAAKVKSIVNDGAHNLSEINYHDLNVDWTPPIGLNLVNDGLGLDIDTFYTASQISANWNVAVDPNSDIAFYEIAVGSAPGMDDVAPWLNVGNTTEATYVGLNLTVNAMYYVSVRAVNGAGLTGDVVSSNGQLLLGTASLSEENLEMISVYPNPITNEFKLVVHNAIGRYDVFIYDRSGRLIFDAKNIENQGEGLRVELSSALSSGVYSLQVVSDNNRWMLPLVKVN
jgi:hypothetical protein